MNLLPTPLPLQVEYRDLTGKVQGSVSTVLSGKGKQDFIINDLGLRRDSYGTVCVQTNSSSVGAWSGGMTIYKSDTRSDTRVFGDGFDFALYQNFSNPRKGNYSIPLNTFHVGSEKVSPVANWISVSDGISGDARDLTGTLKYYDGEGRLISDELIHIPDGGRQDFPAHARIAPLNDDRVGLARFVPDRASSTSYYLTATRYFYDCAESGCQDFLTAFTIPYRPPTRAPIGGVIATKSGEMAVLELTNTSATAVTATIHTYLGSGILQHDEFVRMPALSTSHFILNDSNKGGSSEENLPASVYVIPGEGALSASINFYKVDSQNKLLYAHAVPLVGSPGKSQFSDFNSFIDHRNVGSFSNLTDSPMEISLDLRDLSGRVLDRTILTLPAFGSHSLELITPKHSYGTMNIRSNKKGLIFRRFTQRYDEYVFSDGGL